MCSSTGNSQGFWCKVLCILVLKQLLNHDQKSARLALLNSTVNAAMLTGPPYRRHRARTSIATLLVHDKEKGWNKWNEMMPEARGCYSNTQDPNSFILDVLILLCCSCRWCRSYCRTCVSGTTWTMLAWGSTAHSPEPLNPTQKEGEISLLWMV